MIRSDSRWVTAAGVAGILAAAVPAIAATEADEEVREHQVVIKRFGGEAGADFHRIVEMEGHGMRLHFEGGGFLGVRLVDLTPELRAHFGIPGEAGVMVSAVVEDSPAFRAGIEVGDIVTGLDGEPVRSSRGLAHSVRDRDDGETVLVELWRDGRVETASAAIEHREPEGFRNAMKLRHPLTFGCDAGEDCFVEIRCEDEGECSCEVDGVERDCADLPGPHSE